MYCTSKQCRSKSTLRETASGFFLALLLLGGCAGKPTQIMEPPSTSTQAETSTPAQTTAEDELEVYRQAITDLKEKQLDSAEAALAEITVKRPELAGPWVNMALVHIKKNNLAKAEDNLNRALERNPDMPQAFNLLGFIEKKKGNIIKAKEHYLHAISNKADYAIAHYNVALLYDIYLQDTPNAIKHYKHYLEITGAQDKETIAWVKELERSLARGSR